ncbi:hypothetical protein VSR01_09615 [Actinacidiphila sp. DG2A-62]|uniref:hypothetical protein n=1 Tax=Actinacidiphila sp. DG2A-62 TaxID=3108821 RepID=UPI002DB66E1D|nr:hypothetical protein [Actinacidiphila sp. DG2A-62]MEC3993783.1 hypothetical protein [Actinacidiphila sp. DG2A-62]
MTIELDRHLQQIQPPPDYAQLAAEAAGHAWGPYAAPPMAHEGERPSRVPQPTSSGRAVRSEMLPEAAEFIESRLRIPDEVEQPASARVEASRLLGPMLRDPATVGRLSDNGVQVVVVPRGLRVTDLPEFAGLQNLTAHPDSGGDRPVDDLRGLTTHPGQEAFVAIPEENLVGETAGVGRPGGHYPDGYSAATHELAHMIYEWGLTEGQRGLIRAVYDAKRAAGPDAQWPDGTRRLADSTRRPADNYSSRSAVEYFAQSVNAYLGTNHGRDPYTGQQRNNGADRLRETEPAPLIELLATLFGSTPIPLRANPIATPGLSQDALDAYRDFAHLTDTQAAVAHGAGLTVMARPRFPRDEEFSTANHGWHAGPSAEGAVLLPGPYQPADDTFLVGGRWRDAAGVARWIRRNTAWEPDAPVPMPVVLVSGLAGRGALRAEGTPSFGSRVAQALGSPDAVVIAPYGHPVQLSATGITAGALEAAGPGAVTMRTGPATGWMESGPEGRDVPLGPDLGAALLERHGVRLTPAAAPPDTPVLWSHRWQATEDLGTVPSAVPSTGPSAGPSAVAQTAAASALPVTRFPSRADLTLTDRVTWTELPQADGTAPARQQTESGHADGQRMWTRLPRAERAVLVPGLYWAGGDRFYLDGRWRGAREVAGWIEENTAWERDAPVPVVLVAGQAGRAGLRGARTPSFGSRVAEELGSPDAVVIAPSGHPVQLSASVITAGAPEASAAGGMTVDTDPRWGWTRAGRGGRDVPLGPDLGAALDTLGASLVPAWRTPEAPLMWSFAAEAPRGTALGWAAGTGQVPQAEDGPRTGEAGSETRESGSAEASGRVTDEAAARSAASEPVAPHTLQDATDGPADPQRGALDAAGQDTEPAAADASAAAEGAPPSGQSETVSAGSVGWELPAGVTGLDRLRPLGRILVVPEPGGAGAVFASHVHELTDSGAGRTSRRSVTGSAAPMPSSSGRRPRRESPTSSGRRVASGRPGRSSRPCWKHWAGGRTSRS